jgi:hypothetical protein
MDGTTISRGFRSRRQEQTPKNLLVGEFVAHDSVPLVRGFNHGSQLGSTCTAKRGFGRDTPECMDPPCVARENGEPGVRSCTNVSGLALELVLRTIMEIRAHPILLAAMPLRAISGVSSRMRREDQLSISSLSLADLGGETIAGLTCGFWQS